MLARTQKALKLFIKIIVVVALVVFLDPRASFAVPVSRTTGIRARVNPGGLTLTAPATVSLPAITVSDEVQALNLTATNAIELLISDLRGDRPSLGWSVTMTVTPFSTDAYTIPITSYGVTIDRYTTMGGDSTGITLGRSTLFADSDLDGVSNPVALLTAAIGRGVGKYKVYIRPYLNVPAFSPAGDYSSTITETIS